MLLRSYTANTYMIFNTVTAIENFKPLTQSFTGYSQSYCISSYWCVKHLFWRTILKNVDRVILLYVDGRLEDSRRAVTSEGDYDRLIQVQQSSSLEINPSYGILSRTTEDTVQTQVTTTTAEVYEVMNTSHSSTRQPQTWRIS